MQKHGGSNSMQPPKLAAVVKVRWLLRCDVQGLHQRELAECLVGSAAIQCGAFDRFAYFFKRQHQSKAVQDLAFFVSPEPNVVWVRHGREGIKTEGSTNRFKCLGHGFGENHVGLQTHANRLRGQPGRSGFVRRKQVDVTMPRRPMLWRPSGTRFQVLVCRDGSVPPSGVGQRPKQNAWGCVEQAKISVLFTVGSIQNFGRNRYFMQLATNDSILDDFCIKTSKKCSLSV